MAKAIEAKSIYRKLSGRNRGLMGYSQLWLGPDHILLVKSTRVAEQYQRFALSDIQSITVTEAPSRLPVWIAEAAVAILWTLVSVAVQSIFAKYFFAITGALALVLAIIDIARGPLCRCYLTTAVTRERLRSVSRMRAAQAFLAIIVPAIETAQGRLSGTEEIVMPAAELNPPPEVPPSTTHLPEVVFALFLIDAALILLALRFPRSQTEGILPTTFIAEIVLLAVALIQRGKDDRRRLLYGLLMLAIVGLGWDAFEVGHSFRGVIGVAAQAGSADKVLEAFNNASWRHGAWIAATWRMAAGATGLAAAFLGRTK